MPGAGRLENWRLNAFEQGHQPSTPESCCHVGLSAGVPSASDFPEKLNIRGFGEKYFPTVRNLGILSAAASLQPCLWLKQVLV